MSLMMTYFESGSLGWHLIEFFLLLDGLVSPAVIDLIDMKNSTDFLIFFSEEKKLLPVFVELVH